MNHYASLSSRWEPEGTPLASLVCLQESSQTVFSQTAEYALRAVCAMARDVGALHTTEQLAETTQVPLEYLRKVLQSLSRSGIVSTQRGSGGGVKLAQATEDVTVLDVVNAVDPIRRIDDCPLGLAEHDVDLCPMHSELDRALALMEQTLASTTIANLLAPKRRSGRRCRFPNTGQR